ncbi:MAG: hypothetical protein AB7E95_01855 [Kiritimatiellales bacterium]
MNSECLLFCESLSNMPWEERPSGCSDPVWRYSGNPVIGRNPIPSAPTIYNSAVVPYNGEYIGVFRADHKCHMPHLHLGRSRDALNWEIEDTPIQFEGADPEISRMEYAYDPRVCRVDDTYYISWCTGYHGPTIGLAKTRDFQTFTQLENAFLPYNRNGVLFPKKINGNFMMLSRPSGTGHCAFGEIYISESPDLCFWGKHRFVMGTGEKWWDAVKIGAGPVPIETSEGWLVFYHGVIGTCNGFIYSMGAALLDREHPSRVLARLPEPLLSPECDYEVVGKVPNVVFPCATLCDADTGRIALYYGAADTVTAMAFCFADEIVRLLKQHRCS